MTFVSVLAVFGSNGAENKSDKFQKLFYDGLVAALGSYASDVDAVVATSAPITDLKQTEKFGTALIQKLSSGAPLRALFQPELHEFQAAFEEAVAEAVESGVAVVAVVYAGEVLHSTGEWLLADSTFSGEQLQMWLDSEAQSKWQPEIQKLTSAPTGTEPITIVVCTPSAGAKTRWPMASTPNGSTQLVMLSKSRRLPVRLQTTASWRVNGKLASSASSNATSFEALHALSGDLARLHWEHQSKLLAEAEKADYSLAQRSFKDAPPALYLLPSGPGGVQTQACGLLVIQGVNILLGSAFTDSKPPQWWPLVRSLDRLDSVIFPDWSAPSIQSFNFLTKHLLSATSSSDAASWLGWLFAPPIIEPGSESPLLLTPPTSNADPSRIHALATSEHKTRLFYKIGVGELTLHWLGAAVGALLIWKPEGNKKGAAPLTVFLPVTLPSESASTTAAFSPAALLAGMVRVLRKVPEICRETSGANGHPLTAKRTGLTMAAAEPSKPTMRNGTVPKAKTAVNSTVKHPTPTTRSSTATSAPAKSLASKTTTPVRPTSASKTTAAPASRPSTAATKSSTTPTAASRTVPSRPATASSTASKTARPTLTARVPAKTSTGVSKAPTTTSSVKTPKKSAVAGGVSKTEAKLTEHAAKVAAKAAASKPGHEIKYAPAGRPSNLPPRRKVGEKTVMEELNELPEEVTKSPATTDSLAEPMKESRNEEPEGQVSYPDSLKAEEEHAVPEGHDVLQAEVAAAAAKSPETEMPSLPAAVDFTLPSSGLKHQDEPSVTSPEIVGEPPMPPSGLPESFNELKLTPSADSESQHEIGMTKSPEMEFRDEAEQSPVDHGELLNAKSLAGMQFSMPPGHQEEPKSPMEESKPSYHEDLMEAEFPEPKSPSGENFNTSPGYQDELLISKSPGMLQEEVISKASTGLEFAMPPEHHEEVELSKSPIDVSEHHEEIELSKSPIDVPEHHEENELSKSPIDAPEHQEEVDELKSLSHDEIEKSLTGMESGLSKSPENLHHDVLDDSRFEEMSPAELQSSVPPGHPDEFNLSKSPVEETEGSKSSFHEEIPQSQARMDFSMPPELHPEDSVSTSPQHEVSGFHDETGVSKSPFAEEKVEAIRSNIGMDFSSPTSHLGETGLSESPAEMLHYGIPEHHHEEAVTESPLDEGITKSSARMDFSIPPGGPEHHDTLGLSKSPAEHHEEPELIKSPSHEEISESPAGMHEFSMSKLPAESYHEGAGYSESSFHEEISGSPADINASLPKSEADSQHDFFEHQKGASKSPVPSQEFDEKFGVSGHHDAPMPDIDSKNPFSQGSSDFAVHQGIDVHADPFALSNPPADLSGLSKSPAEAQFLISPDTEVHKDLESHPLHEVEHPHDVPELSNFPPMPSRPMESVDSPAGEMNIVGHHHIETAMAPTSYGSDIDNEFHHGDDGMNLGDYTSPESEVLKKPPETDRFQPSATSTTEEEYPVHEMSLGGGKPIPEVSDHVDSAEATSENMPPIHGELLYQLQSECTAQPADSTTAEAPSASAASPKVGFLDLETLGKMPEENIHSPGSEVSNDSVIHTADGKPNAPGFVPGLVSSSSPTAPNNPITSATSGFSSLHPLLYNQRTPDAEGSEGLEHDITAAAGAALNQNLSPLGTELPAFKPASPQRHGSNGLMAAGDFSGLGTEKPADSSTGAEGSSPVFDPLMQWGKPQGMPAPVLPSRGSTALARTPRLGGSASTRNSSVGTKASTTGPASSKAPENLPPGPPVLMDVVWVPGYIIRVPFSVATQFFTQIRARVYVLSGECLHPITGEAIIAGVSKWTPEEREAVCKLSGGRGIEGINVVPTDEPLDWVRWLHRSAGGDGKAGEERLQAAGITVHSSATLCDIHFSDNSSEINCPGTQLMI
ncbi:hypothetical protein Aperf_G00000108781 [Anoplocephala perfoliata]